MMSNGIVVAPTWRPRQGLKPGRARINAPAPQGSTRSPGEHSCREYHAKWKSREIEASGYHRLSLKLFSGFGHTFPWLPAPDPWATGFSGPGDSATTRHRPGNCQPRASFMLRGK